MRAFILSLCAGTVLLGTTLPVQAGADNGPLKRVATVQSFSSVTFKVAFTPDEKAVVVVQGDGDTTLAVVILDHKGRRVAASTKNVDKHTLRWTPDSDERYQIKVYNRGGVPNRFQLRSN
jgi:hypothetical protein